MVDPIELDVHRLAHGSGAGAHHLAIARRAPRARQAHAQPMAREADIGEVLDCRAVQGRRVAGDRLLDRVRQCLFHRRQAIAIFGRGHPSPAVVAADDAHLGQRHRRGCRVDGGERGAAFVQCAGVRQSGALRGGALRARSRPAPQESRRHQDQPQDERHDQLHPHRPVLERRHWQRRTAPRERRVRLGRRVRRFAPVAPGARGIVTHRRAVAGWSPVRSERSWLRGRAPRSGACPAPDRRPAPRGCALPAVRGPPSPRRSGAARSCPPSPRFSESRSMSVSSTMRVAARRRASISRIVG